VEDVHKFNVVLVTVIVVLTTMFVVLAKPDLILVTTTVRKFKDLNAITG